MQQWSDAQVHELATRLAEPAWPNVLPAEPTGLCPVCHHTWSLHRPGRGCTTMLSVAQDVCPCTEPRPEPGADEGQQPASEVHGGRFGIGAEYLRQRDDARGLAAALEAELALIRDAVDAGAPLARIAAILDGARPARPLQACPPAEDGADRA